MKNQYIQLVPANISLTEQVVNYYKRNRTFLEAFEPIRNEEFFSFEHQQKVLKNEMLGHEEKNSISFLYYTSRTANSNYRRNWIEQCDMGSLLLCVSRV